MLVVSRFVGLFVVLCRVFGLVVVFSGCDFVLGFD